MTTNVTTLPNGLRIVSDTMPHLETVSLGVWVAVGARHETLAQHGLSHLLEHMAFKGTVRRTAREIVEEIETVGGDLNAATSLETTAYYARVLKGDEGLALEILADILRNSLFEEGELTREQGVVIQEISSIDDNPEEIAYDLLVEAAYPDQAAGRPIIGTPKSVSNLTASDLRGFLADRYAPCNMIVAAAGAVRHGDLVRHATALFGTLPDASRAHETPARYAGGVRVSQKRFEQCHFVAGFEGPSYLDDDFYAAQVLSGVLGGGASSRLFQEIREQRGLCYAIYSSAWGLKDTGMLAIHAATGPESLSALAEVIGDELRKLKSDAPSAAEVARAKAQMKAGLMMALESSSARAEQMARQLLSIDRLVPAVELSAKVDAVTPQAVLDLGKRLFSGRPSIALVGAGRRSRAYAAEAERVIRA